jgi:hypothetical protein
MAAVGTATAGPVDYTLVGTTLITPTASNNQGGRLTGFDISFVDPVTGDYYLADRSNATVDVLNGNSHALIGQVGTGLFAGQQLSTATSGPNGVLVVNDGTTATLYAGDANSTLRTFNVNNPSAPVVQGTLNTGGGTFRVDEMAYSSTNKTIFAANNANSPAFATLINATPPSPTISVANITIPFQVPSGGMEQSVWNPGTATWFVSVPSFNGADAGGVQEFSPAGSPLRTFNFTNFGISSCSPTGLGLGSNGNLMVGCGNSGTQTVVLNPAGTGSIVNQLTQVSGSDQLWYDPTNNRFYVTGVNAAGDRVIDVFDGTTYALLQEIDLTLLGFGTGNMHSVAVDPLNGDIFVPIPGNAAAAAIAGAAINTLCPTGCVAVFAEQVPVPEPSSFAILLGGLLAALGIRRRLRWQSAETRTERGRPQDTR